MVFENCREILLNRTASSTGHLAINLVLIKNFWVILVGLCRPLSILQPNRCTALLLSRGVNRPRVLVRLGPLLSIVRCIIGVIRQGGKSFRLLLSIIRPKVSTLLLALKVIVILVLLLIKL